MLHDNTAEPITQWTLRVPNQGEFIPIGVRIRSSETPWQTEMWKVVRDGEKVRIIDAQSAVDKPLPLSWAIRRSIRSFRRLSARARHCWIALILSAQSTGHSKKAANHRRPKQ